MTKQISIPRPLNSNILETFSALSGHSLPLYVSCRDFHSPLTQSSPLRITRIHWAGLIIKNGQRCTWMNTWDSRNDRFSQQSLCPREQKSWGRQRVSITKSIMVCWTNEKSACAFEGIRKEKKALILLIYIRLFWKLQKLDYRLQSLQNMVARYWRLTRGKQFCTETWEMTRYKFDRQIGGQSLFLNVKFSCFTKASMASSMPHEGGTFTFLDGWRKLVIQRLIMRRQFSWSAKETGTAAPLPRRPGSAVAWGSATPAAQVPDVGLGVEGQLKISFQDLFKRTGKGLGYTGEV